MPPGVPDGKHRPAGATAPAPVSKKGLSPACFRGAGLLRTVEVEFQRRENETVNRRFHAQFGAQPHDGAGQCLKFQGFAQLEIEHEGVRVDTIRWGGASRFSRSVNVPAGRLTLRGGISAADRRVYGPRVERWLAAGEEDEVAFEDDGWDK